MVRINLLPVRAERKKQAGQQQVLLMLLAVAAVIVVFIFWFGTLRSERKGLESRIQVLNGEVAKLEQIIGEVKKFTETKTVLEEKLKVIEKLKKGRSGPVRVLDELAQKIPKKVWLVKFEEKDSKVNMVGEAATDEDVADFMQDLKKSDYFKEITLKFTKIAERSGVKYKQFEMSSKVNYGL